MSDRSVHADSCPLAIFLMTRLLLLSYSYSSLGAYPVTTACTGFVQHHGKQVHHARYVCSETSGIMRYNVLNNRRKLVVDCHAALRVWSALYCCTMPTELFNNRYELRTDMYSACQRKLNW
jgi:hypothetical protein